VDFAAQVPSRTDEEIAALYNEAVVAIDEDRLDEAKQLLLEVLKDRPEHEQAWFWLAGVVTDLEQTVQCLQRVLTLNPDNTSAREWLSFAKHVKSDQDEGHGPAAVEEEPPVALLGKYLLDHHFISSQQLQAAVSAQKRNVQAGISKKIGELLIEQRSITREQLNYAIREQERDFYSLFRD
jgi:hypothetical protein